MRPDRLLQGIQFAQRIVGVRPHNIGGDLVLGSGFLEAVGGRLPVGKLHVGSDHVEHLLLRIRAATEHERQCYSDCGQRNLSRGFHIFLAVEM